MNIAVVDVAAESSGALSVLLDFYKHVKKNKIKDVHWYFFTSVVELEECNNVSVIKNPNIKKSWFHRSLWENLEFPKLVKEYHIDTIFSLQNKALPIKHKRQIVYFHNALHFLEPKTFNILDSSERPNYIYCKVITPITFYSYKYCDEIITQTEAVKTELEEKVQVKKIVAVYPDVNVEIHSGSNLIKGFIYPCGATTYKKHELIVEAVKKAGDDFKGEILFTFKGNENKYALKIKEMARKLNNIKFIGFLPRQELMRKYEQYGLIFASDVESFPIPFAEAMAYGAPILARKMPYATEILDGYTNGFLYEKSCELAEMLKTMERFRRQDGVAEKKSSSWGQVVKILVK